VFCVSRHLAEGLIRIGCPPTLIHVNPSGVSVPDFPEGRPEPGRVLAVGRLVEKKAPHLTIEAFALAARRMPAARLDMVGDGPLAERCQALIARLGIADRVTLHGALGEPEIRPLLRRAAIFVQHSVTAKDGDAEGFPTAIAEAMSTALPVVSTRHGGIPEHVKTGESGFLVAEGDVPGMADAITRLLDSPDLARRMGAAGRRHAMRHLDRERARRRVRDLMGLPYAG
jgi:glycosyltransferase involved in cell wall biosynthesis